MVSSDGTSVLKISEKGNHEIKIWDNGIGYKAVKLKNTSGAKNLYVHRLVYRNFVGAIPDGMEINHVDHDKSNNSVENLELVSHLENLIKMKKFYGNYVRPRCKRCSKVIYMDDSVFCTNCLPIDKKTGKRIRTKKEKERALLNRKVERPDRETLLNLIYTTSFLEIGRIYGVSDNAVRKWCKSYELPFRKKDIEQHKQEK